MNYKLEKDSKIFVAGAKGMVGSALVRKLKSEGFSKLLTPSRSELDCTEQSAVRDYLSNHKPDCVIIAAAKVGGILANSTYPADFLYENLMLECNLIHESHKNNVERLLFLGSTCIYPKFAPQPIPESALLTGPLEPTNEAYAIAKIAGVKLCQFYAQQYGRLYTAVMPTNLYGSGDNYHPENSHVIPALIRRFHEAKIKNLPSVALWGSGTPKREFLFVDDLADALYYLLGNYMQPGPINVGSDEELTIRELADAVARATNYRGQIVLDPSKPDGTPRKKTDLSLLYASGWRPKISLSEGLKISYDDFLNAQTHTLQR